MLYTFDMEDDAGNEAMESFLADYTENQYPLYDYESRTTYAAEFESFGSIFLLLAPVFALMGWPGASGGISLCISSYHRGAAPGG